MFCLTILHRYSGITHQAVYESARRARGAALRMLCTVYADELGYKFEDLSIRNERDLKDAFDKTVSSLRNELYVIVRPLDQPYRPY